MSEGDVPRRMRVVAMGAALAAMLFTLIAVIVVLTRDDAPKAAEKRALAPLTDHDVQAANIVRVKGNEVELVVEKGATKGVRIKDPALAKDLGLEPDDVITSVS